jgi:hypothetical protein
MLRRALFLPVLLFATPALAAEIRCEGAFAIDTSEARLIELYGKDNVNTGEVPGPEGSIMIATTVFGGDPAREMQFVWWDDQAMQDLSSVTIPPGDSVGGVSRGMSVREVEALNGEPFTMTGFWWDYGGYSWFQSGRLAELPGGCILSVNFLPQAQTPAGIDDSAVSGDVEVPSGEPLLETLDVRVESVSIGYPHPDFRDPAPADDPALPEDTRG